MAADASLRAGTTLHTELRRPRILTSVGSLVSVHGAYLVAATTWILYFVSTRRTYYFFDDFWWLHDTSSRTFGWENFSVGNYGHFAPESHDWRTTSCRRFSG